MLCKVAMEYCIHKIIMIDSNTSTRFTKEQVIDFVDDVQLRLRSTWSKLQAFLSSQVASSQHLCLFLRRNSSSSTRRHGAKVSHATTTTQEHEEADKHRPVSCLLLPSSTTSHRFTIRKGAVATKLRHCVCTRNH